MNSELFISIPYHRSYFPLFGKIKAKHNANPVIDVSGDRLYIIRHQEWKMDLKKIPQSYLDSGFTE